MTYGAEPGGRQTDRQNTFLLRAIVLEASNALANLDADRLEELAFACHSLTWDGPTADHTAEETKRRTCREFVDLERTLALTRANRGVLRRIYVGRVEYNATSETE